MQEKPLITLSMQFGCEIYEIVKDLRAIKEFYLANQLLRSSSSIGANIFEGQYAHSRADFIAKFQISLKEANEVNFWLEYLLNVHLISQSQYDAMRKSNQQIISYLVTSVLTAKANAKKENS